MSDMVKAGWYESGPNIYIKCIGSEGFITINRENVISINCFHIDFPFIFKEPPFAGRHWEVLSQEIAHGPCGIQINISLKQRKLW